MLSAWPPARATPSSVTLAACRSTPAPRFASPGEFAVSDSIEGKISGEIGKRMIVSAKIEKMIYLDCLPREVVRIVDQTIGNPDEAPRIAEGKRTNKEGIHDTEDGGTGSDAEACDAHRGEEEANVAAERANCVTQVLQEGFHR